MKTIVIRFLEFCHQDATRFKVYSLPWLLVKLAIHDRKFATVTMRYVEFN